MEYIQHSSMNMPALGFGTFEIQGDVARNMVEYALNIGYRHIDTAQIYDNETEVGQGLSASRIDRSEVFITTKVWVDRFARDELIASVEQSLRRLATDHVDLLLLHWPVFTDPMEATLEALMLAQDKHLARYIGVSNFNSQQLQKAVQLTGAGRLHCNQVEYHPFLGQTRLIQTMRDLNVPMTAYMPLAKGRVVSDPTLEEIAARYDKSAAQVALRWLLDQNVAAIPATTRPEHARQNLDVFAFQLDAEDREKIAALPKDVRVCNPTNLAPEWD